MAGEPWGLLGTMMPTPARYRALQWFLDHEAQGPDEVFNRRPPSARMRKLMAKEGQVVRLPLGQFEHHHWRLTPLGREVLEKRLPRKKAARCSGSDSS
jgi:hypothetical protein